MHSSCLIDFIAEELPRRQKSGYTFGSRFGAKVKRSQTPGPQYKPEDRGSFQPVRGFSFGHRPRFGRRISDTPGPGEYDQQKFLFKDAPAYSFGVKNHKRGQNDILRNKTPAPVDYQPENCERKTAPSYSFGTRSRTRFFTPKDFDIPGPGEFVSLKLIAIQRS